MEREKEEVSREEFEEVLELSRENNRILKSIQRSSRLRKIFSIIYFVVIIGGMLYLYYFFQPYIENVLELYEIGVADGGGRNALIQEFIQQQSGN